MKTTRILTILILTIICGIIFMNCLTLDLTVVDAILLSIVAVVSWLSCIILECIELIKMMKPIKLICPKCENHFEYKNYWVWVLYSPFHWFGKRLTKCPFCGYKSWMKRDK